MIQHCYHLLENWKRTPGIENTGKINKEDLDNWVSVVKRLSIQNGIEKQAMMYFGKAAFYAPADEDGFFIDSRQGNMNYDLTVFKEIPIIDCITGGETTIKHLDGNTYKFTIKPGMKEGNIVRLREKGLRDQNGKRGFLNIVIKQKMPSKFTKTETELLNKLRRSKNFA